VNVAVVGEAGCGKSMLLGSLLHSFSKAPDSFIERLRRESIALSGEDRGYAYLLDKSMEERRLGHTLEVKACEPLEIRGKAVRLVDTPGLERGVHSLMSGLMQADAVLAVADPTSSSTAKLEDCLTTAALISVAQCIAVVSKMDAVGYSKAAYESTALVVEEAAKSAGIDVTAIIPVSARERENIAEPSSKMSWYSGPTLAESLAKLREPERLLSLPMRLPVQRYYERPNVITGVVATGVAKVGMELVLAPSGAKGVAESIESWGARLEEAKAGEDIGVKLKGIARYQVKRGFLAGSADSPPKSAREITARVHAKVPDVLKPRRSLLAYVHQARAQCQILEAASEGEHTMLKLKVEGTRPLPVEEHSLNPVVSRIALRAQLRGGSRTVAGGVCIEVLE